MNKASIGKRIRTCREEKGWSQEAFAEKIGLSIAYRFDRELSFYKRRFLRMDKHRKPPDVRRTARRDEKIKIKNKDSVSARVLRQKRCFFIMFCFTVSEKFLFPYARGERYNQREYLQSAEEHIERENHFRKP